MIGEARVNRLWRAYLSSNAMDRRELENSLEAYAAQVLHDSPATAETGQFPPPPEKCLGDIDLGKAVYGGNGMYLFGLRSQSPSCTSPAKNCGTDPHLLRKFLRQSRFSHVFYV